MASYKIVIADDEVLSTMDLKEMLEEEGIILRMVSLTERTLEELEDEN